MRRYFWGITTLLAVVLSSCKGGERPEPINRFADQKLQKIYDLQDQRKTKELIPFLRSKKVEHREAAALAFASIMDPEAYPFLKQSMLTDQKARVRKAAVYAVGQLHDSSHVGELFMAFEREIEVDVRKYILEALGKSANRDVVAYFNSLKTQISDLREGHVLGMYRALRQRQVGDSFVSRALSYFDIVSTDQARFYAASLISRIPRNYSEPYHAQISEVLRREKNPEVIRLLEIVVKPSQEVVRLQLWENLVDGLPGFKNRPYEMVKALRETDLTSNEAKDSLRHWALNARYQIVRTTAAELFVNHLNEEDRNAPWYDPFLRTCLASRDMALQSIACYELTDHPQADLLELLKAQRDSLALPRQTETLIDFNRAISAIDSSAVEQPKTDLSHRIDWDHVMTIPSEQKVLVETNKGKIAIRLYVDDAPASVSNFLKLVADSFYNDKFFHRVVPNFVIQGGCPRGDGWGALDWSQRSEFSNYLRYEEGTVGLASAGKDTEGVQFFITHNPTPFLDGRYTIFGRVLDGMDVVNQIVVGDKIIRITKI